ncbi:MAG: nucleotidyltransferase domain-containing protein [Candidatus Bilamarchaeaceae archaeon]
MECGLLLSLFFAFFVAHSAFFIIDSHLWAVLRIHKWPKAKYISYIRMIANDVNKSKHIRGAAIFGSFSKRNFNEFSDLDLALVPKEGAKNFIMTYFLGVRLKSKALFTGFPLDLSIITNLEYKLKSTDKMPIILYEHSNYVSDMFPHAILLTEFITQVYNS